VVFANAFFSNCGCAKANLTVNIVRCPKGHVTGGRDDTCNRCPKGLFSFNSQDVQCSICGANTVCPGGVTVWAAPGFWHSASQSIQMHRWVKVVVVVWMHVGSFDGWKRCVCVSLHCRIGDLAYGSHGHHGVMVGALSGVWGWGVL
jgi:hypothetical protein